MNVYVRELSRELGRMGVAVDVFTRSQNPAIPRVVDFVEGVRVVHLAAGPEAPLPRDAVRAHLDEFVEGVDAWRIARGTDYDLVHAHYWLSGVVGLELRERWGAPVVQMFHTLARLKNRVARSARDREPALRLAEESRIAAAVDRIVAATTVERDHFLHQHGVARSHVAVIPCGVDTELFAPGDPAAARDALALPPGPVLLYVGRLTPIKGLDTLLEAMARLDGTLPRARLLIVGGEADEPLDGHAAELRRRLRALGLERRVTFVGAQPQERLRDYYRAADVTVLPSYYESFGMVAMEAMACGSPVVASRVGGLQTTVRDGVTGVLVPDSDPGALAEALVRVADDRALRGRLAREGVAWAARHRWPCVAEAVCREYATLVARAGRHLSSPRCV